MADYTINSGDIFKVGVYTADSEQESVNSFNVQMSYIIGVGITDQQAVNFMSPQLSSTWLPVMGSSALFRGTTMRLISPAIAPPPRTKFSTLGSGPGTAGASLLPRQTSGLISWYTDFRGPHYRARTYVPFPCTDDDQDPGKPTPVYVGHLGDISVMLLGGLTLAAGGATLKMNFGVFLSGVVAFQPFTASVQHDAWATQKRRGSFGRLNKPPF